MTNKPPNGEYRKDYAGEKVLTADRVVLRQGLRVWDYDLRSGEVDLADAEYEWNGSENRYVLWFRVRLDDKPLGRGSLMSHDRVAVRHPFTHKEA